MHRMAAGFTAVQATMKTPHAFAPSPRGRAFDDAIEWEELPSLAERLVQAGARQDFAASSSFCATWDETLPAAFDPLTESGPFTEPLRGLVTREVREPDVFRYFFA